jgi:hypothetical protein
MYFRFGFALTIVVAISVAGIMIEKENLRLERQIARQKLRQDLLVEEIASARTESQQLGAPPRLLQAIEDGHIALPAPQSSSQLVRTEEHEVR